MKENKDIISQAIGSDENECGDSATFKHKILNICVLAFSFILTGVALTAFLVASFTAGNESAYSIASIYILCMLLAAPTLKVFLDKVNCPMMKKLNIAGIISIFAAILISAVVVCIQMGFGL